MLNKVPQQSGHTSETVGVAMTELDWFSARGQRLLSLAADLPSERKKRLLACACSRLAWQFLVNPRSREAIESSERYAEGKDDKAQLKEKRRRSASVARGDVRLWRAEHWAADAATSAASVDISAYLGCIVNRVEKALESAGDEAADHTHEVVAALVRDIFGNSFHRTTADPAWLAWKEGTVQKVAQAIYEDRCFDQMSILADALEEAGCADPDILTHCREPGAHVRGCWVVDLLLGKN
jgi:hypothetical protein